MAKDLDQTNDPFEQVKDQIRKLDNNRLDEIEAPELSKSRVYALLYGQLSLESMQSQLTVVYS